jgi:acid stress-induced BolA-like protein IbaG/YrbA
VEPEEIVKIVKDSFPDCEVSVSGDGSHFDVTLVGEQFAGMSSLNKQRSVFKCLSSYITSGQLHAVNIHAHSPDEWRRAQQLAVGGR